MIDHRLSLSPIGCRLSAIGYRLSPIPKRACHPLVDGGAAALRPYPYPLSARRSPSPAMIDHRLSLSPIGCRLSAIGYRLSPIPKRACHPLVDGGAAALRPYPYPLSARRSPSPAMIDHRLSLSP
ncbi:hypothetical protein, partial [Chloroflexus sp.]|uniref:hypothetical protein n=1 Tax=Chloroflexus sp. TaxID=1904827 RepID=UPI002FD9CD4D